MKSRKLARRYALALGELACEQGRLDEVERELKAFLEAAAKGSDLRRLLETETVASDEKAKVLRQTFESQFSKLTLNFILLVVHKRREGALIDMIEEFLAFADEKRGVVEVQVTSAKALDEEQSRDIADALGRALGKEVRLIAKEDESLLGGVVARVGDLVMDGSVRTRLNQLGERLRKAELN